MMVATLLATTGCKTKKEDTGPPVPASSDPQGNDLVEGAVVIATEKGGGVRIYKIREIKWFPNPMGEYLVMMAFDPKAEDFNGASKAWSRGGLTVALATMEVAKHNFVKNRDYRVIATEKFTDAEKKLKNQDQTPMKRR